MALNQTGIQFADPDPAKVESALMTGYESAAGRTLFPGDPVRLFLESVAVEMSQLRFLLDHTGKQNLLAFAEGVNLEALGDLVGTERLSAQAARVTVRFHIAQSEVFDVVIPQGTRVTADGQFYFATDSEYKITAGTTYIDGTCVAGLVGSIGNNLLPGQINELVDPVPNIVAIENITTSEGGGDIEGDESLRLRTHEAPEQFSVAGPRGSYRFHALSAHPDIVDIAIDSPQPGDVDVFVLMKDGFLPGQDILDLVQEALDPETVVPLNDTVYIKSPTEVQYDIDATYFINRAEESNALAIGGVVAEAVAQFVNYTASKIGRDIIPSKLTADMHSAGARRVVVTNPTYTEIEPSELAKANNVNIVYGGVIDE